MVANCPGPCLGDGSQVCSWGMSPLDSSLSPCKVIQRLCQWNKSETDGNTFHSQMKAGEVCLLYKDLFLFYSFFERRMKSPLFSGPKCGIFHHHDGF